MEESSRGLKRAHSPDDYPRVNRPKLWALGDRKFYRERLNMAVNEIKRKDHERMYSAMEKALKHKVMNMSITQALRSENKEEWKAAINKEISALEAQGAWYEERAPKGTRTIPCKMVLAIKDPGTQKEKYKARCVGRGYLQGEDSYNETYAETLPGEIIRLLLIHAAEQDLELFSIDIKNAYTTAVLSKDTPIYITLPRDLWHYKPYFEDGSKRTFKLFKSLYGLRQSGTEWQRHITGVMKSFGYQNLGHPCVMIKRGANPEDYQIFAFYVDDGLLITSKKRIQPMLDEIKSKLNCHELGETTSFIGMSIERDRKARTIKINQPLRIEELLQKNSFRETTRFKCRTPVTTSYDPHSPNESPECNEEETKWFQSTLGSLNYIAVTLRPDLCFAVGLFGRIQNRPRAQDCQAIKRCLRYLNATRHLGLVLGGKREENRLVLYTDASHNSCTKTNRSTSGILLFW